MKPTNISLVLIVFGLVLSPVLLPYSAHGSAIPVGSSGLITTLDYSDTYTLTDNGGNPGRVINALPVNLPGINMESNYANPPQVWTDGVWAISDDANTTDGSISYPGTSGAGSDTGLIERQKHVGDWGIKYALRSDFVVQADFVQTADRIDVTAGKLQDNIFGVGSISIFFRQSENPPNPEIGIFNNTVGERDTGLSSGIASPGQWHNYAVRFDLNNRQLSVYVDETLRGVVDLDTVAGGDFAALTLFNDAVSVGYSGGDRGWSDNFQVGAPIPEPATLIILILGLAPVLLQGRKQLCN